MTDTTTIRNDEAAVLAFKRLYTSYGYSNFRMSRFEEYDLYASNKNFLVSDNVITFTDTNGKLLALKPDVTLSIVKNTDADKNTLQKLYYSENVYRVAAKTHEYKEIMQVGLECIGQLDDYAVSEVITLAAKSLSMLDPDYILDLSHMSFASTLLCDIPAKQKKQVMVYMAEKNIHGLRAMDIDDAITEKLIALISIYDTPTAALEKLGALGINDEAVAELCALVAALTPSGAAEHIRFDFSMVSDENYYNGITFAGYVHGVPTKVLSGGRYDNLMKRFKKNCGAIGFAIYMDALDQLLCDKDFNEVDTLIIYDDSTDTVALAAMVDDLISGGEKVKAARVMPRGLKYKNIVEMGGGKDD